MLQPEVKHIEPVDYESLNKFLLGTVAQIKRKEVSVEEGATIAKLADKVVKNNLTAIMEKNRIGDKTPLTFFAPSDKQVLIG